MSLTRHSPAAAKFMGTVLLIFAVMTLGMAYSARRAGLMALLALLLGGYLALHGTGLWLTADDRHLTMKKALVLVALMLALGFFGSWIARNGSIWG